MALSEKQLKALEIWHLLTEVGNAGKANLLLDDGCISDNQKEATTQSKSRFPGRSACSDVGMWRVTTLNMIDRITANGWRMPAGVRPARICAGVMYEILDLFGVVDFVLEWNPPGS